jgi:hypothetical protein
MTALVQLYQAANSGRLPDIAPGQVFWASGRDALVLLAAGQARAWQAGDPAAPEPEPPWTANQSAGFGRGTSNCSH